MWRGAWILLAVAACGGGIETIEDAVKARVAVYREFAETMESVGDGSTSDAVARLEKLTRRMKEIRKSEKLLNADLDKMLSSLGEHREEVQGYSLRIEKARKRIRREHHEAWKVLVPKIDLLERAAVHR